MKHIAAIQTEFLKEARKWDDLSLEEQKAYLQRHPKSKRRITAKPEKKNKKVKQAPLYNVNRLTSAGINKRIRKELGLADQYSDVNKRMLVETRDGEKYDVVHSLRGVPKGKLKKIVKKLFGKNDRVSVADDDGSSLILIKQTEKAKKKREQIRQQIEEERKRITTPLEKVPDPEYVKDVLSNSMAEVWLDDQVEKMKNTLLQHFPKKKKTIEKVIDLAGDVSNVRDEMRHINEDSNDYNDYEKEYEREFGKVLKSIDKIMGKA